MLHFLNINLIIHNVFQLCSNIKRYQHFCKYLSQTLYFNYIYKQSFYAITVEGILIVTVPPGSISPTLTIIFLDVELESTAP
jgi:uncharacterized membrane protein